MVAISFIALQCFQCSTMQVKQQKKSSNKWVCAVCNERQSVRRVHARSHLAKDVRLFVQSFNMSRIAHPAPDVPDPTLPLLPSDEEEVCGAGDRRKRMDWTEYLDPDLEEGEEKDGDGFESEPKITTELPQKKFERIFPKCPRDRGGRAAGGDRVHHPVSLKRRPDHCQGDTAPKKYKKIDMAKTESKWSDYLEVCAEEDEGVDTDGLLRSGVKFQFSDVAQVEEEVHPDFKFLHFSPDDVLVDEETYLDFH